MAEKKVSPDEQAEALQKKIGSLTTSAEPKAAEAKKPAPVKVTAGINNHADILASDNARFYELATLDKSGTETGETFTVTRESYLKSFASSPNFLLKKSII